MTPEQLYAFARGYAKRHDRDPTVATCARRFRCRNADVLDAAECGKGELPMDITVGWRCGSGIATIERVGDYEIETWAEP